MRLRKILLTIIITISVILISKWYLINYQGGQLYFFGISGEEPGGYREAELYKDFPTEKLLEILKDNENFGKFPRSHFNRYRMGGRYAGAVMMLGSKGDKKALDKLTEIINTHSEGQKWTAIGSIGKYKNKAMVPVLCEALKRHTDNNTDRLIVQALIDINDPSAFSSLVQEKEKIKWNDSRMAAEKAIEKWNKEISN